MNEPVIIFDPQVHTEKQYLILLDYSWSNPYFFVNRVNSSGVIKEPHDECVGGNTAMLQKDKKITVFFEKTTPETKIVNYEDIQFLTNDNNFSNIPEGVLREV